MEKTARIRTFIPDIGTQPPRMALPRTAWVRFSRLGTGVVRSRSCLFKFPVAPSAALWVWCRRTNRWPCCHSLSNPSTSLWSAWPDPPGWWNNRIAAQQYPDYSHLVNLQPGQLPHKTTATWDNCHAGHVPPGQLPPRTITTHDHCHLGQSPPKTNAT